MSTPAPDSQVGREFAWKVHDALGDWTARVDTKASIVLSLQALAIGYAVTQSGDKGPFSHLTGTQVWEWRMAMMFLVAAVFLSGAAVFPQLRRRKVKTETGLIYFGHLKRRDPQELIDTLLNLTADKAAEELAGQLKRMSIISWRKHSLLQVSMILTGVSGFALILAGA